MKDLDPAVVSRNSQNHRTWGEQCDAWELVSLPEVIVVAEAMPPGTSEVRHHHQKANQFFYVLSGELTIVFGPGGGHSFSKTLGTGEGVSVPAKVEHQAMNRGQEANSFLAIAGPTTSGDRIEFSG